MSDTVTGYVRTYVPILVGSVISWLFVTYGVVVSDDIRAQAVAAVTGAVIALYYAAARTLEKKWPVLGKLLGSAKTPTY